ncbi:MAG TPA: hypothetical protein VNN72_25045 [Polyangiaceae bacterium]|nr:hypothetical protein [Polyangiaceae bacterium]
MASVLGAVRVQAAEPSGAFSRASTRLRTVSQPPADAPSKPLAEAAPSEPHEETEEDRDAPYAPSRTKSHGKRWYGWQTLLADTGSVTFFFATGKSLEAYALLPYAALGPTIHFAHGNVGMGLVSFGSRVFLPLGGALTGMALGSASGGCGDELECVSGAALGFVVGMAGAIAIDASLLAYDDGKRSAPASRATLRLAPSVAYDGKRGTIGLVGHF